MQLAQPADEVLADARGVGAVLRGHQVERRERRRATHGIAAVRVAVCAALPLLHQRLLRDHHADRQARAEPLRERHDVRHDAEVLRGEHLAGAADARLHFVEDQQNAVPVAQRAQALQEAIRRHQVTALALDRLDQDRRDFVRRHVAREQHLLDVVEHRRALIAAREQRAILIRIRHVRDARHRREEAFLLRVLARRERERAHRAAVEAAEKADEARRAR